MASAPQGFVAKAGWMHRQSEFLRRWKRQWCVLYADGGFACYADESKGEREVVIRMNLDAKYITSGYAVRDIRPPDGRTYDSLIAIKTYDTTISLCAENSDDCKAWVMALEQMKALPAPAPVTVQVPNQNVTIVHQRRPPPAYRATTVTTTTYPNGQTVVTPGSNQAVVYPHSTNTTYLVQSAPGQAVYYDYRPTSRCTAYYYY
ncbi:pleckstrin homology domain-containing family B member 2-like isoform X2 [Ptychodera flava]|uniref:pleckstrin homology domain-containing family B member 2-like isoform X2 n=1 Tax=Ptychodera flava TaxID=63121 RepID=UPI003969D52C